MGECATEFDVATERREAEVCTLAGQLAAATCRFVLLVAELDRRETWREWGCRSTAHWLSWKCAVGLVAAREQVRVGRALQELPKVRAAFGEGRLSYSKVRALTRVATPAREAELLEFALVATAAQLERTVRGYERTRGDAETEAGRLAMRSVRFLTESDGTVTMLARLTPEQAQLVRHALDQACREVPVEPEHASGEARRADALELLASAFLAGSSRRVPTEVVVHIDADAVDERSPVVERLLCDGRVRTVIHTAGNQAGRVTRTIPPPLRRLIERRDRNGCPFPGCANTRFVHVHHIRHFAAGGPTSSANCILMCTFHHRLVHDGGWNVVGNGDQTVLFASPDGRRCFTDQDASAEASPSLQPTPGIDASSIATATGERLDLALAVGIFHDLLSPDRN